MMHVSRNRSESGLILYYANPNSDLGWTILELGLDPDFDWARPTREY